MTERSDSGEDQLQGLHRMELWLVHPACVNPETPSLKDNMHDSRSNNSIHGPHFGRMKHLRCNFEHNTILTCGRRNVDIGLGIFAVEIADRRDLA